MASAFTVEDVADFAGAFSFTLVRLLAAADVGANLVAADNLLPGHGDRLLLIFCHFQISPCVQLATWDQM